MTEKPWSVDSPLHHSCLSAMKMKLLFSLLTFLAGINMCIAISVSPRDHHPVPHSLRQSLSPLNGTVPIDDEAEHDQRDRAEEDRGLWGTRWTDIFTHSNNKGSDSLREHFLSQQVDKDAVSECLEDITALVSQTIRYDGDKGPQLNKLFITLKKITKSDDYVLKTRVAMFQARDTVDVIGDAWLASKTKPDQLLKLLKGYLKRQGQTNFVQSDLFIPWLKYVHKYWTKCSRSTSVWNSLVASSNKLNFFHHYPNGLPAPLRTRLSEGETGTFNALFKN